MNRKCVWIVAMCLMATICVSCLEKTENNFRVTVPTYATVTYDGAGGVRLFMDERRGVVTPSAESAVKDWKDARRVYLKYDLPMLDTVYETRKYTTIIRDAHKLEVVDLVDVTGMEQLPAELGDEVVADFNFHAYRGYITIQAAAGNSSACDITCSYDRDRSSGDTLFLRLHYARKEGSWNIGDIPPTVSAEIPSFLQGQVKADNLCIVMTGKVWKDFSTKKDTIELVRTFDVSRGRLTTPEYGSY